MAARSMRVGAVVAFLLAASSASARAADVAATPGGPAFGANRVTTTIDPVGGAADVDDFTASLAKGERLSVAVVADPRSALRPTLTLVDPAGTAVDPGAAPRKRGTARVLTNFVVGATGRWTVRVGSADPSQGGDCVATFRVAPPRTSRPVRGTLDAATPTATHAFDAVAGSTLSFALRSRGGAVAATSLVDPAGRDVPIGLGRGVRLAGGDGTYRLTVATDPPTPVAYSLALRVKPPPRPTGRSSLGAEPWLEPRAAPIDVAPGGVVRLVGARFAAAPARVEVSIGDAAAPVLATVGPYGAWLDVGAPLGAVGDVFDVVVRNPDGQSIARRGYVRLVAPTVLDVASLAPAQVVLPQGGSQDFTVTLTQPAPPFGVVVSLASEGGLGSMPATVSFPGGASIARFHLDASVVPTSGRVEAKLVSTVAAQVIVSQPAHLASLAPSSVHVLEGKAVEFTATLDSPAPPIGLDVAVAATNGVGVVPAALHFAPGETSATFSLAATDVRAAGKVIVTSADVVSADVVVAPPDAIDLSGWSIVQQNASRTFVVPSGTALREGGYLVVGRKATRQEFETFWGRTLGDDVVYVNALDQFLVINGGETFELRDPAGNSVDGPSAAMPAAAGAVLRRVPGAPAQAAGAWSTASASPVSNATPGAGQTSAPSPVGAYVSEFADANGSGNFVYEFVEICFDRLP